MVVAAHRLVDEEAESLAASPNSATHWGTRIQNRNTPGTHQGWDCNRDCGSEESRGDIFERSFVSQGLQFHLKDIPVPMYPGGRLRNTTTRLRLWQILDSGKACLTCAEPGEIM